MKVLIILSFLWNINAGIIDKNIIINSRIALDFPEKQNAEVDIENIRQHYLKINGAMKSYRKVTINLPDQSAEGGELNAYYDGKILKKMVVVYYGETGKAEREYYFDQNQVIFQFWKTSYYDKPIYINGAKVKSISEDRFYFKNGNLIKWIKPSNKNVDVKSAEFVKANLGSKEDIKELKEKLSQK